MKTENLIILGALAIGGYLLWKSGALNSFFGEGFPSGGGGSGGGGSGGGNGGGGSGGGGYRGYTDPGTGPGPAAYEVTTVTPMTTKVQMTGGNLNTFQNVPTSTRAALITVGTPTQQIQQFNTAPKVVKIDGKFKKVM